MPTEDPQPTEAEAVAVFTRVADEVAKNTAAMSGMVAALQADKEARAADLDRQQSIFDNRLAAGKALETYPRQTAYIGKMLATAEAMFDNPLPAEDLVAGIINALEECKLDFASCRSREAVTLRLIEQLTAGQGRAG
jgi:ParB-like chromosome segregation protein Spo0J